MFLRCDVESGAGEWVVSSLAASFLTEGITHPEDVGTLAPRGALYLVLELNCIQVSRVVAERAFPGGWFSAEGRCPSRPGVDSHAKDHHLPPRVDTSL